MSEIKKYYGMDLNLKAVTFGYKNIFDALKVIDERCNNQKEFYENSDQALSETMFGFGEEDEKGFVDICIHGNHPTHFQFEYIKAKLNFILFKFPLSSSYEIEYQSIDIVKDRVAQFFKLTVAEFIEILIKDGAKKI